MKHEHQVIIAEIMMPHIQAELDIRLAAETPKNFAQFQRLSREHEALTEMKNQLIHVLND